MVVWGVSLGRLRSLVEVEKMLGVVGEGSDEFEVVMEKVKVIGVVVGVEKGVDEEMVVILVFFEWEVFCRLSLEVIILKYCVSFFWIIRNDDDLYVMVKEKWFVFFRVLSFGDYLGFFE